MRQRLERLIRPLVVLAVALVGLPALMQDRFGMLKAPVDDGNRVVQQPKIGRGKKRRDV